MAMQPIEYFLRERGYECEYCGMPYTYDNAPERHHAIIRRRKGNAMLDEPINIQLVCHNCHQCGEVDSFENRQAFVNVQIERGFDVGAWCRSLPLKYIEGWLLQL